MDECDFCMDPGRVPFALTLVEMGLDSLKVMPCVGVVLTTTGLMLLAKRQGNLEKLFKVSMEMVNEMAQEMGMQTYQEYQAERDIVAQILGAVNVAGEEKEGGKQCDS